MTFQKKYVINEKDRLNNMRNPTLNLRLDEETYNILLGWGELLDEQQRGTVLKRLVKFANDVALGETPASAYASLFKKKVDLSNPLISRLKENIGKSATE